MSTSDAGRAVRQPGQATTRVGIGHGLEVGGDFVVIAGPCALESAEQVERSTAAVKQAGGHALRGGAFKPRTSPYSFQGLGEPGLKLLKDAGQRLRMPVVSEVLDAEWVGPMSEAVDVLQIGARNMQNFSLLRAVAKSGRPVLLKRGFGNTLDEWLLAAEYLLDGGNQNVILCERGIRSFDTSLRNTLDLAGMALMKERTHLPVLIDPSHATGRRSLVTPMALAAAAAGADGLLIEVHSAAEHAMCDGAQALDPQDFANLMNGLAPVLNAVGRRLAGHPALAAVGGVR